MAGWIIIHIMTSMKAITQMQNTIQHENQHQQTPTPTKIPRMTNNNEKMREKKMNSSDKTKSTLKIFMLCY